MENAISEVIRVVLGLFLTAITAITPLLIFEIKKYVSAKLSAEQMKLAGGFVRTAVYAAEQLGLSGGEAKKYAVNLAESLLKKRGINVELDELADLVEAALFEGINKSKNGNS